MERLFQANKGDEQFFGLYRYGSWFAAAREKDKELRIHTSLVYLFKKYGKHQERIKTSIELAKQLLDCQQIVIVPPSKAQPNALQTMFSCGVFARKKEVASRKYNHKAEIDSKEQSASLVCDYGSIQVGASILLVDDVITSGKTMFYFRDLLAAQGYKVIMFGLGLRDTLKPVHTTYEYEIPDLSAGELETLLDDDLFSVPVGKQHRVTCHSEEEIDLVQFKIKQDYAWVKQESNLARMLNLELVIYRLQHSLDTQEIPDTDTLASIDKAVKMLHFIITKM